MVKIQLKLAKEIWEKLYKHENYYITTLHSQIILGMEFFFKKMLRKKGKQTMTSEIFLDLHHFIFLEEFLTLSDCIS